MQLTPPIRRWGDQIPKFATRLGLARITLDKSIELEGKVVAQGQQAAKWLEENMRPSSQRYWLMAIVSDVWTLEERRNRAKRDDALKYGHRPERRGA